MVEAGNRDGCDIVVVQGPEQGNQSHVSSAQEEVTWEGGTNRQMLTPGSTAHPRGEPALGQAGGNAEEPPSRPGQGKP